MSFAKASRAAPGRGAARPSRERSRRAADAAMGWAQRRIFRSTPGSRSSGQRPKLPPRKTISGSNRLSGLAMPAPSHRAARRMAVRARASPARAGRSIVLGSGKPARVRMHTPMPVPTATERRWLSPRAAPRQPSHSALAARSLVRKTGPRALIQTGGVPPASPGPRGWAPRETPRGVVDSGQADRDGVAGRGGGGRGTWRSVCSGARPAGTWTGSPRRPSRPADAMAVFMPPVSTARTVSILGAGTPGTAGRTAAAWGRGRQARQRRKRDPVGPGGGGGWLPARIL